MTLSPDTLTAASLPWWATLSARVRAISRPLPIAIFYLVVFAILETITVLVEPRAGQALYLLLLFVLILHTNITWQQPIHRFLLSLAFVPLIRVISLSLPMAGIPLVYWYLIVSVPLYAATIVAFRLLGLRPRARVFSGRGVGVQLTFALTGILFGLIEYTILQPEPLVLIYSWERVILAAAILLISTGLLEEIIFRGIMQRFSINQLGPAFGVVYVALIFAILHIGYNSLLDIVFVLIIGLLFGWFVYRTGSLLGVTLSHSLTNIVLFLVIPFWLFASDRPGLPALDEIIAPGNRFLSTAQQASEELQSLMARPLPTLAARAAVPTPAATPRPAAGLLSADLSPDLPSATATPEPTAQPIPITSYQGSSVPSPCGLFPADWTPYEVRWGNMLSQLALDTGTTVQQIVQLNCIDMEVFYSGMQIYLPPARSPSAIRPLLYTPAHWYIASPRPGTLVSGNVPIMGGVDFDPVQVQFYKIEMAAETTQPQWIMLGSEGTAPVEYGLLATLQTESLLPGNYLLRLVLISNQGIEIGQPYTVPFTVE